MDIECISDAADSIKIKCSKVLAGVDIRPIAMDDEAASEYLNLYPSQPFCNL